MKLYTAGYNKRTSMWLGISWAGTRTRIHFLPEEICSNATLSM